MKLQAVYFNEENWSPTDARVWLKKHNLVPIKRMRREGHNIRYRITDPKQYIDFITKKFPTGIYMVFGIEYGDSRSTGSTSIKSDKSD